VLLLLDGFQLGQQLGAVRATMTRDAEPTTRVAILADFSQPRDR
jgi:hypothetical protein